jgi:heterodisulfide reductase subunit A-like polyferredoxin/coenzyme F420-reducing hydrogenase delta subunit
MPAKGKSVVVIGAGPAGLAAALDLNASGLDVHLVEQSDHLGGRAYDWSCMATEVCEHCGACLSAELAESVLHRDQIHVHTNSRPEQVTRTDNGFDVALTGSANDRITADAILLATGFMPFNPTVLPSLGYGQLKNVITTAELNTLLKTGRLQGRLPGDRPPVIAFIQCVGSRNPKLGRDYCSQVCCKISLRQANKLLHLYPEADLTVFHLDLQLVGKQFRHFYRGLAHRVKFIQGVPAEAVLDQETGAITLYREGPGMNDRISGHFDMVVLSIGMGPAEGSAMLPKLTGVKPDAWGFVSQEDAALPKGVYAAGTVRGPMDILGCIQQGRLAAAAVANNVNGSPVSLDRTLFKVAVVGSGHEARQVAEGIWAAGYPVVQVDARDGQAPGDSGLQYRGKARLTAVEGVVGSYGLRLATAQGEVKERVAALVIVSGTKRVDFLQDRVLSLDGLAARRSTDVPPTVAFWLDYAGPEWKDNAERTLIAAMDLAGAGKTVYVMMEKMLVSGLHAQQRYDAARRQGVKFIRIADRSKAGFEATDSALRIHCRDSVLPDTELNIMCDLLVIPDAVQPDKDNSDLAGAAVQAMDAEGFLQAPNVRHRLVGSPRKGLFFAGTGHDEIYPREFAVEIQTIVAALDRLVVDGTPDEPAPVIREQLCARCLTCYRICPHRAIVLEVGEKPMIRPEACFACGLCVSSCPAKAISQEVFDDAALTQTETGVHTVVFACQRSAWLAAREASRKGAEFDRKIKIQPVPCAGRVSVETMMTPLLQGVQRVVIAGCHPGNCRSMGSGPLTAKRLERLRRQVDLSPKELGFFPVAANEPHRLRRDILEADGKET